MPWDPGPYNALQLESRTRWKGLCPTSACNKDFSPKIVGDSLGVDSLLGTAVNIGNPDRKHPRVQRYRASVQRELANTGEWGSPVGENRGPVVEQFCMGHGFPKPHANSTNSTVANEQIAAATDHVPRQVEPRGNVDCLKNLGF